MLNSLPVQCSNVFIHRQSSRLLKQLLLPATGKIYPIRNQISTIRNPLFHPSNLPFFHSSIVELFLEKTKIQRTIEEQILLPPNMAQLGQRSPHIRLSGRKSLQLNHYSRNCSETINLAIEPLKRGSR
jgi:hypothetical protein